MDESNEKPVIRKKQMEAFSQAAVKGFEDRTVVYLCKGYPEQCEALGKAGLGELIKYGIKRAAEYGMKTEYAVEKYIELMLIFGRDFDTNTELPWAGQILSDKTFKNSKTKADHLYDTAMNYVDQSSGPDRQMER